MNSKHQYISVLAICLTVVLAAAIITYKPLIPEKEDFPFMLPSGIPPSLGSVASTWVGEQQVKAIYVSGSGSASDKANQATVTLGVYTENKSASRAIDDNSVTMNAVVDAIHELDISDEEIKTVQYSVYPNYNWEVKETTGYRVTNMIQIEIKDRKIIGAVIDAAARAGANNIQGISFGLSNEVAEGLRTEAYTKALEDARKKANLIADTLQLKITGVHSVTESAYYPYTPYKGFDTFAEAASAPTPIFEGSLSVSVNVQLAFTFE